MAGEVNAWFTNRALTKQPERSRDHSESEDDSDEEEEAFKSSSKRIKRKDNEEMDIDEDGELSSSSYSSSSSRSRSRSSSSSSRSRSSSSRSNSSSRSSSSHSHSSDSEMDEEAIDEPETLKNHKKADESEKEEGETASNAEVKDDTHDFENNEDFIAFDFALDEGEKEGDRRDSDRRREDTRKSAIDVYSLMDRTVPWWSEEQVRSFSKKSVGRQLHEEIKSFCSFIEPCEEEIFARKQVISGIEQLVKSLYPDANVKVFGSFDTNMYLPTSDIDLVIFTQAPGRDVDLLKKISKVIKKKHMSKLNTLRTITKARVPIIKFKDNTFGYDVDISINIDSGIESAAIVKNFLNRFKGLRELCLIIKHLLSIRGLNEVFSGGLGSYSIILTLLSFMQLHPLLQLGIEADLNLGILFLEYLELYGRHFHYERVGIDVSNGGSYYIKRDKNRFIPGKAHLLSIQDPQDPENDVAKSTFNISAVRNAFDYSFRLISNALVSNVNARSNSSSDNRYNYNQARKHAFNGSYLSLVLQVESSCIEDRKRVIDHVRHSYSRAEYSLSVESSVPKQDGGVFVFKANSTSNGQKNDGPSSSSSNNNRPKGQYQPRHLRKKTSPPPQKGRNTSNNNYSKNSRNNNAGEPRRNSAETSSNRGSGVPSKFYQRIPSPPEDSQRKRQRY